MERRVHFLWFIVIPVLCLMAYGYCWISKKPYNSPVSYILKDGCITEPMKNLLKLSYIEYDGSLQDAVAETQKHWLKPAGVTRWEMDTSTYANRREIWEAFEKIHIVQRIEPVYSSSWFFNSTLYDYIIVLGDVYDGIKAKMKYIKNIHERGVNCGLVIFFTTDRLLDHAYEIEAIMQDFDISVEQSPKTESDMVKFVAEKMLPQTLGYYREREYIIASCIQEDSQPDVKDILHLWLAKNPQEGKATCLVISAQPHIAYHHSVFATYMPEKHAIQTVGPATIEFMHTGVYFDTLACLLHQENLRIKK